METSFYSDILRLIIVVLLILGNGFFVAAEFALVSVRKTRVAEMVAQGVNGAEWVQKAINNPIRMIAAIQLSITVAGLGLGWLGEPALAHLLEPVVQLFPGEMQSEISSSISTGVAFALITFLLVVIGELVPKSIALQNPEKTSLVVARPTVWTSRIYQPFIWLLNGAGNLLLKLIGVKPASAHDMVHSVEEMKMIVTASAEEGVVESDESDMLHAVFDFGELMVRQVMIPRTEITGVEADASLDEIIQVVTQSTYTKLPVYEDDLDLILGIVHVKDLLGVLARHEIGQFNVRTLLREPLYVPETLPVNELLQKFRQHKVHIAIVMDEYGGTAGLITLEDLLEEIVGEVSDPFDVDLPEFESLEDGSYLIDGMALIEDVNHQLGLNLQDPHYDTIAGYVLGRLGRIPQVGDIVKEEGLQIEVETMDGLRIERLSMKRLG